MKIVPGAHESILDEPHVSLVAEELKRSLRRARAAPIGHAPRSATHAGSLTVPDLTFAGR